MEPKKNQAAMSLGSLGGKARAKALTAKRRKEIATEGAKAAAEKRAKDAKAKKSATGPEAGRTTALEILEAIDRDITPEMRRMLEEMEAKRSRRGARGLSKEVRSAILGEIRRAVEEKVAKPKKAKNGDAS